MIQIKSLQSFAVLGESGKVWQSVETIFFESSIKKKFANAEEKAHFRFKYLDWYIKNHPELFFIAIDGDKNIQGYICGAPDTAAESELSSLHPWFSLFSHLFLHYPAHLHINCAENARGVGLGTALLNVLENTLQSKQILGVHLVTSPEARNVGFYDRNGYKFSQTVVWKDAPLLFMGKSLSTHALESQL